MLIEESARGALEVLQRPSTVVAGVRGISPKSNFELARDAVVAALA